MAQGPPALPVKKKRHSFFKIFLLLVLLTGVGVAGVVWWENRPIQPVKLSAEEKVELDQKLDSIQKVPAEPQYEKGTREIVLTERELNGLLNDQTDLGQKLKIELGTGVVIARLETDIDPDLPILGGHHLKARARAFVKTDAGRPRLIFDDLTVWGISLPNDWLGHLKGQDVLKDLVDPADGNSLPGVDSIQVERGLLKIHLKE